MKKTTTVSPATPLFTHLAVLAATLALLASQSGTANASAFQLKMRSRMGDGTGTGPQGWASSVYSHHDGKTNQLLEVNSRGLAAGQVYHLMASWGTNGELMHLSDFMPNRSGTVQISYLGGGAHHFNGTNSPGLVWGMTGAWTNQMSWVVFPGNSTNWCDLLHGSDGGPHALTLMTGMTPEMGGMGGNNGGMGNNQGGMGWMDHGWPTMTNWWSEMPHWGDTMANWCWDYTNMWNMGAGYGATSSNLWGHLSRGGHHMMPLPASVDPVPVINALVVMDDHFQPVLSADLATPNTFAYSARCDLTNPGTVPGAKGTLQANATQRTTRFTLSATGLAPHATYYLDVNGVNVMSMTSNAHGQVRIRKLPEGLTSVRGIGSVAIRDSNHNIVLSAVLPPD